MTCEHLESSIKGSSPYIFANCFGEKKAIRRLRKCKSCGHRWYTIEIDELVLEKIKSRVKYDTEWLK